MLKSIFTTDILNIIYDYADTIKRDQQERKKKINEIINRCSELIIGSKSNLSEIYSKRIVLGVMKAKTKGARMRRCSSRFEYPQYPFVECYCKYNPLNYTDLTILD
jgi:hypothetical protein